MRSLHIGLIAAILLAGSTSFAQDKKPALADLNVVVKILKDPNATEAQRHQLVGKTYAGEGKVVAVHISSDNPGLALVDVDQPGELAPGATVIHLRFAGRTADPKVGNLQPDQPVRVRGTLQSFSITDRVKLAIFGDLVVQ